MKIKIQRFADGRESYSTPNISGSLNGEEPVTEEVELPDKDATDLLDNPTKFKIKKDKKGHKVVLR